MQQALAILKLELISDSNTRTALGLDWLIDALMRAEIVVP